MHLFEKNPVTTSVFPAHSDSRPECRDGRARRCQRRASLGVTNGRPVIRTQPARGISHSPDGASNNTGQAAAAGLGAAANAVCHLHTGLASFAPHATAVAARKFTV